MKYIDWFSLTFISIFILILLLAGCSTIDHSSCIKVVSIECKSNNCKLTFSDGSDFYMPKAFARYMEGQEVCEKRNREYIKK